MREIEKTHGITIRALSYHYRTHLLPMMAMAKQAEEVGNADAILTRLQRLETKMWNVLDRSEKDKEYTLTVQAAREIRGCLELCAKLAGQIQESTVINIVNQPEWAVVQNVLMLALEEHPAARIAVAKALEDANTMNQAGYHA
jgi:hypothetical protein